MESKVCTSCEIEKPISEFGRNKSMPNGYTYFCKGCLREKSKQYYADNKEHMKELRDARTERRQDEHEIIREALGGVKICPECEENKPFDQFTNNRANKDGLSAYCISCGSITRKQWRKDNYEHYISVRRKNEEKHRERHRANDRKAYWSGNGRRERSIANSREYYKNNKERVLGANKRWRKNNPGYMAQQHRIRDYLTRRFNTIPSSEIETLIQQHNNQCGYCGVFVKRGENLHIDHIVPLSKGGEHKIENLMPACATCNLRKGTKSEEEFRKLLAEGKWYQ